MTLKMEKGVLILYQDFLKDDTNFKKVKFSTSDYRVSSLDIADLFTSLPEIKLYFEKVSSLEIVVFTHSYFTNNTFNFTNSFEYHCKDYFKAFNDINVKITKNILITACQGFFAHIYINQLKEGSRICTLSMHNTLTHFEFLLCLNLCNQDNLLYKSCNFITLVLERIYLFNYNNNSIFYPIISGIINNKPKMRCLLDNLDIRNINVYNNIVPTLNYFNANYKSNKNLEKEYLIYVHTIFEFKIKCSPKRIFKEISKMLKKIPIDIESISQVPDTFTFKKHYYRDFISNFEVDIYSLYFLVLFKDDLDFSLPSTPMFFVNLNHYMRKYIKKYKETDIFDLL